MKNEDIRFNTKKMLSDALKKKMHKKAFSKIKITEIMEDCNLSRNTFYCHFTCMDQLLKWTVEQDVFNVIAGMDLISNTEEAIRFMLDYVDNNKFIVKCAYDYFGKIPLEQFFYTDMKSIIDANLNELEKSSKLPMSNDECELFSMFFTEGMSGILIDYANSPRSIPKDDIVRAACHLLTRIKVFVTE